jgi:hypothetical protein
MQTSKSIGIKIFAVIAVIYGVLCIISGILNNFIFGSPHYSVYVFSVILMILGFCFIVSGLAILKKKLWAKKLFLLAVLLTLTLETCMFVKLTMNFCKDEIYLSVYIWDAIELSIYLIFAAIAFWYFNKIKID